MIALAHALCRRLCRLRVKATALLSIVVLTATGLTAALYVQMSRNTLFHEAEQRVQEAGRVLAIAAAEPLTIGDRPALLDVAQQLVPEGNVRYVAFADPQGRVLAGAQHGRGHLSNLLYDQGASIPIAPLRAPMLMHEGDENRLDVTFPVLRSSGAAPHDPSAPLAGFVRLGLSLQDAERHLDQLTRRVAGIAILIAFLMVPLGFAIVNRIAKPLGELIDTSREWAVGRLERRIQKLRSDEIGDLAAAFNSMADDLTRSRNDLLALNSELEDRVVARTFQLSEVNRELRQEMAEKEDFLRTVSHDLSAPLRNVAGMVGIIRERHKEHIGPDAAALLDRIEHNVRHELELINELLELSHIRTRRDTPQRIDLDAEVRGIAQRLDFELANKSIQFSIARPLPTFWAEKVRMVQLFQNLIDNAIKYTDTSRKGAGDPPCRIVLNWHDRGEFFEFRIADNGIGIESRDRDRIFYVFRRAKNGFVAKTPGKGVGLANCKCIVQNYNGRIWVEPNPEGGSVFCFTLAKSRLLPPVAAENRSPAASPAAALAGIV